MNHIPYHIKNPLLLIAISFFLCACIFYLDESNYSLDFLQNLNEAGNLFIFSIVFSVLPLILYHWVFSTRFKEKSFLLALIGYTPALCILGLILFS